MPIEPGSERFTVFMSYDNSVKGRTWTKLAAGVLGHKYTVHDYQERPEVDAELPSALKARIKESDVFVAFLTQEYYKNRTTREELDVAIKLSTGNSVGSLKSARGRPIVYIVTGDAWAEAWCTNNHPQFTYFKLSNYDFNTGASIPIRTQPWDDWIDSIQQRVATARDTAKREVHEIKAGESRLVILGLPEGVSTTETRGCVKEVVDMLQFELPVTVVPDGWYNDRGAAGAEAARKVIEGGSRSLLVLVCNKMTWDDNHVAVGEFGDDLKSKLRRTGLSPDEAQRALSRTWMWLPDVPSQAAGLAGVRCICDEDVGRRQAVSGSATSTRLTDLIRTRLCTSTLRLEAEDGIRDIGQDLNKGLLRYFNPMLFELVEPENLSAAIKAAIEVGAPVLVAIHDRKIDKTVRDKLVAIRNRANQFDVLIQKAVGDSGRRPKIARAVFILNHADEIHGSAVKGDDWWNLIPIDAQREWKIPPERLQVLKKLLGLPEEDLGQAEQVL